MEMLIKHKFNNPIKQKYRKILKIASSIIFAFLILLIGVVIFISVRSKSTGKIPTFGGFQIYSVLGGSMEPNIHKGSVVILKRPNLQALKENDVITFISPSDKKTIVTHRINKVNKEGPVTYTTRGDANAINDIDKVPTDNLIGQVITNIPFMGYLMNFAKAKVGLIVLIIIPGVLIIIFEVLNLKKMLKHFKKQKEDLLFAKMKESLYTASVEGGNVQM